MCSVAETERCRDNIFFFFLDPHLFAADAQRFGDDLDETAVAQTQLGARKVAAHLTPQVLSHQLAHTHTHTKSFLQMLQILKVK